MSVTSLRQDPHMMVLSHGGLMNKPVKNPRSSGKKGQLIHSGHFMISEVHTNNSDEEDEGVSGDVQRAGFDFVNASKETSKTYTFGNRSSHTLAIDASLTKLFECMTLAYSGKLTSPKWKPFRGMSLKVKDKIRLNNIIWREWVMQYIYGKKPVVCQFATPMADDLHTKPEAIVLEGYYWKRKLDTVTEEYKQWRKFFKERINKYPSIFTQSEMCQEELLDRVGRTKTDLSRQQISHTDLLLNSTDFQDMMDLSESLFASLNTPFAFPNPRELSGCGYGDIIQPGLLQLQPNLEDFMELDPINDLFSSTKASTPPTTNSSQTQSMSLPIQVPVAMDTGPVSGDMYQNVEEPMISGSAPAADPPIADSDFILNQLQLLQQQKQQQEQEKFQQQQQEHQQQQLQKQQQDQIMLLLQQNPQLKNILLSANSNTNTNSTARESLDKGQHPSSDSMSLAARLISQKSAPTGLNHSASGEKSRLMKSTTDPVLVDDSSVRKSSNQSQTQTPAKKDGFTVPVGTPKSAKAKQRSIAPAPAKTTPPAPAVLQSVTVASPSSSNSYLAQLLTTGTYKGAFINVKQDPEANKMKASPGRSVKTASPLTIPTIPPQATVGQQRTVSSTVTPVSSVPVTLQPVTDFPTSVLLAAASQTLNPVSQSLKDVLQIMNSKQGEGTILSSTVVNDFSPGKPKTSPDPPSQPVFTIGLSSVTSPAPLRSPEPSSSLCEESATQSKSPEDDDDIQMQDLTNKKPSFRRSSHLSAEKKRRVNIKVPAQISKSGFDLLHTLIPSLSQNPNSKVSKAAMLQKTAEYCKKLKLERNQMQNEADILKQEISSLNHSISICQSQLPATGVPVTRQRADQMKEMFEEYIKIRTLSNWKFWIFSLIIRNLFDTYNSMVSTANMDELCRTVLAWLDQHCSLVSLRPVAMNAMRHLSTTTSILSDPTCVPEQAAQAVIKKQAETRKP